MSATKTDWDSRRQKRHAAALDTPEIRRLRDEVAAIERGHDWLLATQICDMTAPQREVYLRWSGLVDKLGTEVHRIFMSLPRYRGNQTTLTTRLHQGRYLPGEHEQRFEVNPHIKRLIHGAGLTGKALAVGLGVSPMTVSKVVRGRIRAARVREHIAGRLNMSVKELWPEG